MTTTTEVPGRFDIGIDGTGFMLMEEGDQPALTFQSLPQQREQQGGANANIGEVVVNPEGFWRRSRDGWSHGAGQSYGDRDTSDTERFHDSHGLDVFGDRHYVKLVHAMDQQYDVASPPKALSCWYGNGVLVIRENDTVKKVLDPLTTPWTPVTVTGMTAGGFVSAYKTVALLGDTGYAAMGTNGMYYFDLDGSAPATGAFTTDTVERVWAAKGRLLVANTTRTKLYNPVTSGSLPTALMTLASGLEFVDVAEGVSQIYVLVSSGVGLGPTRPVIYRTAIKADGTALDVPVVAFETASAERGVALLGHGGFVFLITAALDGDHGFIRMLTADDAGNLTSGSAVPLEMSDVNAMAAFNQFVWFGNSSGDIGTISAELGKLNLRAETDPFTPAYAHDLIAPFVAGYTEQDAGGIVVLPGGVDEKPIVVVAVPNVGVFMESTTDYTETGFLDSGLLAVDLADLKTPVSMDVEAGGLDADNTITEALSVDRGSSFTTIGTWNDQADADAAVTGVVAARQFEIRTTLTGDGTDTPVLYRHTLKTEPHIALGDYLIVRLRLFEDVIDNTGSSTGRTPNTDIALLQGWQASREVLDVQAGSLTYTATLRDLQLDAQTRCASADDGSWNTVATARFKIVAAA